MNLKLYAALVMVVATLAASSAFSAGATAQPSAWIKVSAWLRATLGGASTSALPKPKLQPQTCIGHNGTLIVPVLPSDCAGDIERKPDEREAQPCTGRLCPEPDGGEG